MKVTGSMAYAYGEYRGERVRTYALAADLLCRDDYPCEGLLSHVLPISEYGAAFQAAMDKKRSRSVKVALDVR
ncbi:MAG: hypothetical protein HGB17_07585 [Syntrophobacteraceae bacterium]|nr:hypothetical protein [Syntrophobacteraceae bacterium]